MELRATLESLHWRGITCKAHLDQTDWYELSWDSADPRKWEFRERIWKRFKHLGTYDDKGVFVIVYHRKDLERILVEVTAVDYDRKHPIENLEGA